MRNLPGVTTEIPFHPLPVDQSDIRYALGPDSTVQEGVPTGTITAFEWNDSTAYPGTSRTVGVYVPSQYDPTEPASLMVFQDGQFYLDPEGEIRGAIVLDNLIHRGDIPVTIGVFVDPGVFKDVEDPERWGICGGSSGGNCAFTAAWLRPDTFRRVICYLSSFAQMPDGNPYPTLIPQTPRKPLRIFLQAGHRDLYWNQPEWNWLANNLRVAAALAEAEYDFRLVLGDGGHSPTTAVSFCPTPCAGSSGRPRPSRRTREHVLTRLLADERA